MAKKKGGSFNPVAKHAWKYNRVWVQSNKKIYKRKERSSNKKGDLFYCLAILRKNAIPLVMRAYSLI